MDDIAPECSVAFRMTKAQRQQAEQQRARQSKTVADAADALSDLTLEQACRLVLGHMRLRSEVTEVDPQRLMKLSNDLGGLAWELERRRG